MLNLCWDLEAVAARQSEAKDASTYGNIQREAVILQDDLIYSPQRTRVERPDMWQFLRKRMTQDRTSQWALVYSHRDFLEVYVLICAGGMES